MPIGGQAPRRFTTRGSAATPTAAPRRPKATESGQAETRADGRRNGQGIGGEAASAATAAPGTARTTRTADRKLAPATSRAYAANWHHFSAWCCSQGHVSLPAASTTLAACLTALAPVLSRAGAAGMSRSGVSNYAASQFLYHLSILPRHHGQKSVRELDHSPV